MRELGCFNTEWSSAKRNAMMKMERSCRISSTLWFFQGLLFSCVIIFGEVGSIKISSSYPTRTSDSVKWRNLAIDPVTQTVYAGAVNRLFRFDENLAVIESTQTGPVLDNPDCYTDLGKDPCLNANSVKFPSSLMDNFNQVLVVDQKHQQLVTCGNVYQGTCETRSLTNISLSTNYTWQLSDYVVVASRTYPTVAFVGPGPFGDDVLYVGTGYPGKAYTEWFLAKYLAGVSSRNLTGPGNFLVTEDDGTSVGTYGTRAILTQEAAMKYRINYIAGFSLNGFSYFLTTQPEPFNLSPISDVITSKLVQVCQGDKYFDSYVEMRIICNSSGVDYNLIQAAAFIQPGTTLARDLGLTVNDYILLGVFSTSSQSNFGSAVCIYPLSDIRRTFTRNIQKCYSSSSGQVPIGLQFDSSNRFCQPSQASINDSYCGSTYRGTNSPLVGTIPLIASQLALVLQGVNVTAVNAATVDNHTVLFMGTNDGKLLKALLRSTSGDPYERSGVNGSSAVNQDLLFDVDKSHLYLMTSEKIFKIPVSDCEQYVTCDQCLAASDPYCGWCTLEKSCRKSSECPDMQLTNRWLSMYSAPQAVCPTIDSTPTYADINRDLSVTLTITSLPELKNGEYYICVFGSSGSTSQGSVVGSQLVCPMTQNKPQIPSSDDNFAVMLSIQMSSSSTEFIQTNFTFYDCNHHVVCSSCLSTPWSCRWCIFANRCQNETLSCLYNSSVQDKQFCPRLVPDSKEILIPSGIASSITLMANNLPVPQANDRGYSCEISSTGQPKIFVPAIRVNSGLINCTSSKYNSTDVQPYSSSVRLIWGNGGFLIEGSYNATVFNCSAMALGDCSRCLSLQYQMSTAKYGCQLCGSGCQPNVSQCASLSIDQTKCPTANVTSIVPQSGPKEGGTVVTITGTNLGYGFDRVAVLIGNVSCQGFPEEYVISQRYVCVTPSSRSAGDRSLTVVVSNEAGSKDVISRNFVYKEPQVYDIKPAFGPQAGGTLVTLLGKDLDTGSNTSIFIGQQPCILDRLKSNDSQIVCITTGSNVSNVVTNIRLQIDNASPPLNKVFNFTENPIISVPIPNGSFKTGGCTVSIPVSSLDSVANIDLVLESGNNVIPVDVTFRNSSVFQFLSPGIHESVPSDVTYQLVMKLDGIRKQLPFTIHPDPFVEPFDKGSRPYGGDTIQLSGRNMLTPCMDNYQSEVAVYVGTQTCNISSLNDFNLYCKPPNKAPDGDTKAKVTVMVGTNLKFTIGELVYPNDQTSVFWPIIVGVIGGVLVVIIIVLLLIFCIISSKNERQYGKLQAQMEALESGVRNECKQAFTELQTDVSDFTSDLNVIGIPFWDYRMYAFKLLFPMVVSHQVLYINTANGRRLGEFGEKMHRFNQMLGSKYFLLTFIRTMEKQPQEFGITDRSKVASLLSVVLMDKMEYATEIIKILLDDLIVKSIDKRAPKLMLRRAETVVEKLLANWLSLSMFGYLKTHAGHALFMLYKAVKHQTEKGPIDAVTAEARYSLSEDRLLREKLEAKTLNVKVYDADNIGQSPVVCRMLDCDTITQAKEKALDAIYKNTPFSKRPSRNTVDLRWHAGKHLGGYPDPRDFLPLNDQDVTTKTVEGWKRVNTLSHYYVSDESVFQLQKNNRSEPVYQVHGMIELETGTLMSTIRLEEGTKVWHLVKHDDVSNNVSRTQKVISEIFLTRLLSTKMTLQQYIDDLFSTILTVDSSLPPTVKYLYDFLDSAAQKHGINDYEVVHAWKSNSLPLRFWVNLIKNPEFVFDINKSQVVDCCLSVIAQTFMDSCSTHEHRLGKDSPSAKLLFAKDIPRYRQLVTRFYQGIKDLPSVTEDAMANAMADLSATYSAEFNQEVALHELYGYASRFKEELVVALENDPSAKKLHLAEHFEQLHSIKDENPMNSTV